MDDDWYSAMLYRSISGKKLKGKAKSLYEEVIKKLSKPTWSDGASISKAIKQRAPHFKEDWQASLTKAITKGSGNVEDLEFEYFKTRTEGLADTDLVWAYDGDGDMADGVEMSVQAATESGFDYIHPGYATLKRWDE